ncbi:MAG TPA: long-chain fatty acid--CoA ligase [Tenuifilaceae bacterium]|jgi:long-chain acyl-CoA synthetase|nr:long-chain fatty acid--CoA ligase [Bacteroidales bacterium]MDI9516135.1 long-chain fatty acid--CoA ligase [Bacteroidota bacterium]NLH57767.1 long-chain fatty acid--CoA ligase [Rikenellaceae bacterium]OQC61260.1 MAG: Long-chain-fatty-acid--CoA ligase FadD15 [Bacteroidetes bacterium ADurb.Bin008]HNV81769.1 long-chain fatty acid--CoA ligase [Tenuifilaceae bacterium]
MEVTRLFDLLENGKKVYSANPALGCKQNGQWITYGISEFIDYANNLSYGFLAMGLNKGDKVITVTNNRPEWNFVDMGLNQAGMVHVPVYPTISREEYEFILKHSDARLVFVSDKQLYELIKPLADKIPEIIGVFTFNDIPGAPSWMEVVNRGKENSTAMSEKLEAIKPTIQPDDLASMIYTSGTTGMPKGVMLSHKNFLSNAQALLPLFELGPGDKSLSFLPLSHVYERLVNYYYLSKGVTIYYAENLGTIGDNLKELSPTIFVSVPRVLEKTYDKIIAKGKDLKGIKKQLFFWAVNLANRYKEENNGFYYMLKLKLARKLIFSKWKEALGGKLRFIISGGAALQPRLARIFWGAGIPIFEGYGLTETSPVIAVNHEVEPGNLMFGSVGPIVNNIEVKIAEDGEILMKGPSLMLGYYKAPDLTAEVIDSDGWFHTGDIGKIEKGKILVITDRKKEMFKMSSGKYIAPQVIENKLKESLFIEQAMVVGENEKFVSALISPNFSFVHNWCSRHEINFENNSELIQIPEVIARFQKEINAINNLLGEHEKIKRFRLVPDQWSPQTGELSPTLKLRRRILYQNYDSILVEIYRHEKNHETKGVRGEE